MLFRVTLTFAAVVPKHKSYKNYKIYEVEGDKEDLVKFLKDLVELYEIPLYDLKEKTAEILIAPELESEFNYLIDEANLKNNIIVDDFSKLIESEEVSFRGSRPFSWTSYFDVDDIYAYLRNTSAAHPDCTEVIEGGQSYENRKILGLRINTQKDRHDKPVIFIESGIHAREWITPATTTYFINELLTSEDPQVAAMRDQFDWRIFPTVNPDGYHYSFTWDRMWRKTRSQSSNGCQGTDANRNWDHHWMTHSSSSDPCDYQVYAGSKPFSEIETRTLAEYISSIENLRGYIAFHSYAQTLLLPYSDSVDHVDNYDDLVQIGKTSLEYGRAVNGKQYDGPGTAAEILYKASGGSMDWVRSSLGTPLVYTYELRGVYFHWPASRIHEQGDEVTQMMLGLVTEANNLGYF